MKGDFPRSFMLKKEAPQVKFLPPSHYDLKPLLTDLEIYVSPEDKCVAHPRDIFKKEVIGHTTAEEANKWLHAPNMQYWPQQLNFAV